MATNSGQILKPKVGIVSTAKRKELEREVAKAWKYRELWENLDRMEECRSQKSAEVAHLKTED